MLVLSRKRNEKIIIVCGGVEIVITALDHHKWNQTRIGIEAPPEVEIFREELAEYFQPEKETT